MVLADIRLIPVAAKAHEKMWEQEHTLTHRSITITPSTCARVNNSGYAKCTDM